MNKKGHGIIILTVIVFIIIVAYLSLTPAFEKVRTPFKRLLNDTSSFDNATIDTNMETAGHVDNTWVIWPLIAIGAAVLATLYAISRRRDDNYG